MTTLERIAKRIGPRGVDAFARGLAEKVCICEECDCHTYRQAIGVCPFCARGDHGNVRRLARRTC